MNIYSFGLGIESSEASSEVLGGKGAGLVWMDKLGVRVPPGFIIPANICNEYLASPEKTMKEVSEAIKPWMKRLEVKFGYMPLVSVRSGARVSMPGMMDTILNVGLDSDSVQDWINRLGKACVADSCKRLIEMFGSVVMKIERSKFDNLSAVQARDLYCSETGQYTFPNAEGQLLGAIEAVFRSWNNERAIIYRKQNNIPNDWGTAVTIQSMVFGNLNDKSCTGVLFTRDCSNGADEVKGEFLVNAQGEDVVAGIRTPIPLIKMKDWNNTILEELLEIVGTLETERKDVQDVEFTVQDGVLYILQTRNAKRSARATVRIAVEMHEQGHFGIDELFKRISFKNYLKAQSDVIDPSFKISPKFKGIPACAGVATGIVVRSSKEAVNSKVPCILVTQETTPDDIAGMAAAKGVLTMTGGATSHAAVVARSMNKPCVVGLTQSLNDFLPGMTLSLDGATGCVWGMKVPVVSGKNDPHIAKLNALMEVEVKKKGCGIIDDTDGDVLDFSDKFEVPLMAAQIVKNCLKTRERLIIDVKPAHNPARAAFEEMFGGGYASDAEYKFLCALRDHLGNKDWVKLWFITNVDPGSVDGLQMIATVKDYESLIFAQGDFVVDTVINPAMKKLLSWKKQLENAKPISLGSMVEGAGYISRAQLAQALLP